MKYNIIVNPISGRGMGEKSIQKVQEKFEREGWLYTLQRTEFPWHAAELAYQAARDGADVIVAASGDGTINEVINGLMRARNEGFSSAALAILPVGTGNDFAGGIGIPDDLDEALHLLATNLRKRVDLGCIRGGDFPDGRYFGNGVGIGFDAAVGYAAEKIRWTRGLLAYLLGAIQTIFLYYTPPRVAIDIDGQRTEQLSLMVSIMNGQRMGGGFRMAPDGIANDGWFDLCIAETATKLRMFALIPHFIRGTQSTQPEIRTVRGQMVVVSALEGELIAHADGEIICTSGKELQIELLPGALEVVCNHSPKLH